MLDKGRNNLRRRRNCRRHLVKLVLFGRDDVKYIKCSDEHGVISDPGNVLKLNDKLKLIPGHCDPTCNVYDWYVGYRNGTVECLWPVTARGMAF